MLLRLFLATALVIFAAEAARGERLPKLRNSPAASFGRGIDFSPPVFLPPITSPLAGAEKRGGEVKESVVDEEGQPQGSGEEPEQREGEQGKDRSAKERRPLHVGGWTQASYTASTDRVSNLPMGFNDRANQFLLQQNWLQLDRPAETKDAISPTFGFRSDTILPGSDYRFTLPRGLFNGQLTAHNGRPNLYGIDPVQFYAETYLPNVAQGMTLKVGRFYAPWGIETVNAPGNALLSHTYTFVYDPFTQMGFMSGFKLNNDWSGQAGLVFGNDMFFAPGLEPKFSGNIMWAPPDSERSLRFSTIIGSGRYNQQQALDNLNLFEIIYARRFRERLKYTLAATFGYQDNVTNIGLANWLGVQQYWTVILGDRWSATTRLELFDDAEGQRTGFPGLYTVITTGASIQLGKYLLMRPELRYDYNGHSRPFEQHHGLFTAATDLIWRW